jgi:ribosomal protein S18 acetylase RimI-like enzyme
VPHLSIVIAHATPADAGEILTVQRAAYVAEAALHNSFDLPPLTETVDEVQAAIGNRMVLKALLGTRIVGAVRARLDDAGTCHIGRLAVAPDLQGRGIGTRLLAEVEERHLGLAGRLELYSGPKSVRNIQLYRRLGYLEISSPPGGIPTLVYLEKRLS